VRPPGRRAANHRVQCPNQNGDVRISAGPLKRRLKQHLLLRRSRDFASVEDYATFVATVCTGINALRGAKIAEETAVCGPAGTRFPQATEITVRVSCYSTARVKNCAYSMPSRLIGTLVQARVSEAEVSFHYLGEAVAIYPRSRAQEPRIDYRHVIDSLVRKPGAFVGYLYREELFPGRSFVRPMIGSRRRGRQSQRTVLRLLQLAASMVKIGSPTLSARSCAKANCRWRT